MSFCAGEQISLFYVSTTTQMTIRNNAHGMLENILQHSQLVQVYPQDQIANAPVLHSKLHGSSDDGRGDLHIPTIKQTAISPTGPSGTHLAPEHRARRDLHVVPELEVRREDHRCRASSATAAAALDALKAHTLGHRDISPRLRRRKKSCQSGVLGDR